MAAPSTEIFAGLDARLTFYSFAATVTPHDANEVASGRPFRALYIGGAGAVAITMRGDATNVTFVAVPVGTVMLVRGTHVRSTGTTATNIVALW